MSYIYNLTDTWNAAGTTFASIKMAVTNTASSASSNLLDLSISGATTASFTVSKFGALSLNGSITSGAQQTEQGSLILANTAAGAFATTVQSSNSASAAWTLTLPATAGTANYALTTNGSGVSSWSQISLTAGVTGALPLANGGTNANLTASNGGILYSTASAFAVLTGTATAGQMLRSGASGAPSWSTATFPSTATSAGTILRADGTNWVATTATYPTTTTANQLLYSSATNTVDGLTSANTSALVTNSSGVPSFTSGGTANRVLRTDGTTVSFAQVGLTTDVTGTLPVANGGTGVTASTGTGSVVLGTTPTFTTSALFPAGTLSAPGISVSGDTNTGIYFPAADNIGLVTGGNEGMRIDSSSNVGIGTSSPSYKLTVQNPNTGSTGLTRQIVLRTGDQANFYRTSLLYNDSASASGMFPGYSAGLYHEQGGGFGTGGGLLVGTSTNAGPLMFGTADQERMRIDSSGNLLVGTTSAGTLLTVNGVATLCSGTATPAAGSTSARLLFGTTAGFGIYYGSGAPTVSAAQGSIYLRSDGSSTSTRLYVNNSSGSGTTWTNVTTAA